MAARESTESRSDRPSGGSAIHERIRNRRQERGLAGYELARRVGISPSYVSLIERGSKVPSEDIAGRIAEVLEDDAGLYRAWARSARVGDLEDTLTGVVRLMEITSNPRLRNLFTSGEDLETVDSAGSGSDTPNDTPQGARERLLKRLGRAETSEATGPGQVAEDRPPFGSGDGDSALSLEDIERALAGATGAGPGAVAVPVFVQGADPARAASSEAITIDRATLPAGAAGANLFAYRIDSSTGGGPFGPGDLVIVARNTAKPKRDRIYAVRCGDRVVLGQVLLRDRSLLLLPVEGQGEFEVVDVDDTDDLADVLIGRIVLTMKRW